MAELGHTRIPSCQLGQCSDQVEPDRVGMVLVSKSNFFKKKSKVSICKLWLAFYGSNSRFKVLYVAGRTVSENNATGGPNSSADTELI